MQQNAENKKQIREGFILQAWDFIRKNKDLDIVDRIDLYYNSDEEIKEAINAFKDYIMNETLSLNIIEKDNIEEKYISLYLLKCFLGDSFKICVDYEEIEYLDEINDEMTIGNVYYLPKLIISSTKEEIKKKDEITKLEKEKQLVRILKKHMNKESNIIGCF